VLAFHSSHNHRGVKRDSQETKHCIIEKYFFNITIFKHTAAYVLNIPTQERVENQYTKHFREEIA
jgi:hypothetical protein